MLLCFYELESDGSATTYITFTHTQIADVRVVATYKVNPKLLKHFTGNEHFISLFCAGKTFKQFESAILETSKLTFLLDNPQNIIIFNVRLTQSRPVHWCPRVGKVTADARKQSPLQQLEQNQQNCSENSPSADFPSTKKV